MNKGCNFFRWLDNDIVDERDLKIQRQKKNIYKLKFRSSTIEDG